MTTPFKVKAVYEYKSEEPDDLNFPTGQIITVTEQDDEDWYTGEYVAADGQEKSGIFPRNFVEKYEPAVPSRPVRAAKKPAPSESLETAAAPPPSQQAERTEEHPLSVPEAEIEPPQSSHQTIEHEKPASTQATTTIPSLQQQPALPSAAAPPPAETKVPGVKAAPPVAQKPTSSSFKDRIAAFNKPAAPPVAPFKPGGQSASTFIKKPFVAPPPSKNAYIPPPRELPPQTLYRREEEPQQHQQETTETNHAPLEPVSKEEDVAEDQPKPTSLKDRIALLQKQQMEQAQRQTEKKKRVDHPHPQRLEASEDPGEPTAQAEENLGQDVGNERLVRQAPEHEGDDAEPIRKPVQRQPSARSTTTAPQPLGELVSDTNDADESGAAEEDDGQEESTEEERPKSKGGPTKPVASPESKDLVGEDEDEDDEEDPEIRRKRELRERMAKMSGGMGMMGMFGPAPGATPSRKPKPAAPTEQHEAGVQEHDEQAARAPPVPIMALPGMSNMHRAPPPAEPEDDQDETAQPTPREPVHQAEAIEDYISQPPTRTSTGRAVPSIPEAARPVSREARAPPPPPPGGRSMPPLPPTPSSPRERPFPPPPPPTAPIDTASQPRMEQSVDTAPSEQPSSIENHEGIPGRSVVDMGSSERHPPPLAAPQYDSVVPSSPMSEKRVSRGPPPVPMSPTSPTQHNRAPPPPPPGQPPSRTSTFGSQGLASYKHQINDDSEEEVTEYDGDYDTDIASSAKHKDALKSHNRDSSIDEGALTDDAPINTPSSPPNRAVPPIPSTSAPRGIPPPPPQAAPVSRKSVDVPRAPPPPVPSTRTTEEEEYDPFRYSESQYGVPAPSSRMPYSPVLQSPTEEPEADDLYKPATQVSRPPPQPNERAVPPPPPSMAGAMAVQEQRKSLEVKRSSSMRYSNEQNRAEEQGFIAHDVDLAQNSLWWTQDRALPPALQGRTDVLYETDSSTSTKRGGKATVSKDVYVLYMDYSQSSINATFDAANPAHAILEQSHQGPPRPPRRDQLESAAEAYGLRVSRAAGSAMGNTIGDGSPHALVIELLRPLTDVLPPIGLRAYGALVYANLANASTQQHDEIRPGDIVSFRNAKFSGHKGNLHQKYSLDVGRPDHVGVVIEWDGSKKKIRAWEQRGEEKGKKAKVREESFRMGDLKSGEVRVWRLMPRSWVGWDKS